MTNANVGAQARDDMNREQFIDGLYDVELQDHLLREELEGLAQAVARAQALELVNESSRARNRKRLHLARGAEDVPAPVAEVSLRVQGQNARTTPGATGAGRQPVDTDPRIDQLASVQVDLLTQMQNTTAMMGKFVNSIIPAPTRIIYPDPNRLSNRGSSTTPTLAMTVGASRTTVLDATG